MLGNRLGMAVAFLMLGVAASPSAARVPGDANIFSPILCFALTIPGDWTPGDEPGTYVSPDGKQFVGILVFTSKDLKGNKGNTLLEKEVSALAKAYEKGLNKKLTGAALEPFDSGIQGTWMWRAELPVESPGFHKPKRYFLDFSPEGILVLNIQNAPDDDALARRIIENIRYTKDRPCPLPKSTMELLKDIRKLRN